MATISTYSEVWDLDSLHDHPESNAFRQELDGLKSELESLAAGELPVPSVDSADEWAQHMKRFSEADATFEELRSHIGCHSAADATNKALLQLEARLASIEPLRQQIQSDVEFALRDVSDADFEEFVGSQSDLSAIEFALSEARSNARLRLPREQELLAADLAVDGIHAWGRMYDRICGELKIEVMERGEIIEKSPGQVGFDSAERSIRENNFFAADKAWHRIGDTCADALNHLAGTRLTIYGRLGLTDHLDVPLQKNRLQRQTLETMWSTITDRKPVMLKYMQAKSRLMGIEKMAWYDQLAPLQLSTTSPELSYSEACELIFESFGSFDEEFCDFARRCVADRWIEAENRGGKRQGGFCTGFPLKQQSRIFMTFTNTIEGMSTLAHEIGHAYHSYVLRDQPLLHQQYPMNLAETASTFAEAVLGAGRLTACADVDSKLQILDTMLSDSLGFLMNIHARFIFEDSFHRERPSGELTADRFRELMLAAQKEAFLNGFADDGWNPNFWISKLHFYISEYPFYNFPYTFGYLLSLGLFALAGDGDDFPGRYREFLTATGCQNAEDTVQSTFGHDLGQPDFWNRSLDIVEERVNQFADLANARGE